MAVKTWMTRKRFEEITRVVYGVFDHWDADLSYYSQELFERMDLSGSDREVMYRLAVLRNQFPNREQYEAFFCWAGVSRWELEEYEWLIFGGSHRAIRRYRVRPARTWLTTNRMAEIGTTVYALCAGWDLHQTSQLLRVFDKLHLGASKWELSCLLAWLRAEFPDEETYTALFQLAGVTRDELNEFTWTLRGGVRPWFDSKHQVCPEP